ncbi:class I SAM-dependent methyltransferase [Bacillus sp. 165]|uniref:class I SAM-dependent methyltransferase n=1 Tax=Bacillus sp. 165 TaxID=1529117 RepID=UPI001ADB3AB1|nr:class I SAM-dependent methyltransferase [Bacillus sp. 165]MBO9131194.1 class I SAM-dependent methyltransferase [Bacillus sp. 165]
MSSSVETLFHIFDTTALVLRKEMDITYLEALAETGDNLFEGQILQESLTHSTIERLTKEYNKYKEENYKSEDIRKAFQLALLKGMKDGIQANHEMTPDAVSLFVSYLFNKFMEEKESFVVFDPAVGTGNLLTAVLNNIGGKDVRGFGSEVDELLLRLAFVNANLQRHTIEFFNQDSLAPLYLDPVDAVLCDLPVGYYPNDLRVSEFILKADEGLSYAHHLFIEQSLKYTKEGGFLFFIIPNFLFESDQAPKLHAFLKEHAYIQGVLQLPVSMFKTEKNAKSIFVLQKKGTNIQAPKQALLVELPKFTNMQAMENVISQINEWFTEKKEG